MDERRLTFIIVPHGDLETRTYEISYRRLKVLLGAATALLIVIIVVVAMWFPVLAQAARVPGLLEEVRKLEEERAKVAELARTLTEVEAQYERVRRLLGADTPARGAEPVLPALPEAGRDTPERGEGLEASRPEHWPLSLAGYITQRLTTDSASSHPGVDVAVPLDSYVRAAGAGIVQEAGEDSVYGRYVVVDHGDGLSSLYGHASRVFVEVGDRVEAEEVIALTGSTGRSTAPHLHFELRRDGRAVDPLEYVRRP